MVPQSLIPLLMMSVCSNYMGEDYVGIENEDEPRFLGCILNEPPPLINKKFVIATLRDPPLSDMDENGKGVGIIFDFIEILRKKFGFTYTVKVPKENIIGNKEIGVLSMVHRGEADIAAAFLPVLPENMEVAKLSFSLGEAEWVILMRRPSESANGSGLFAPFDTTVWLLILTSLILVGPAIFIIIMIRVKLCKGSETLTRVYPLDACVWFVYGALMKQGSTLSPVADSSRLLFATWWIFITILTSFYTANLTAFLTLSRFTLPIDDARGVAKYRYRWIGHKGFALDQMVATDPGYEYLNYSKRRGYGEFVTATNDEMMKKVDSRNVMYLRERNVVEHLMLLDYLDKTRRNVDENKRCTFVITPKEFMRPPIAIAYTRNSTLNKLFDPVIMSLVETGIIKHLMKRHLPSTKICPLDLGSKERQLRNSDLFMTYIIVMSGYAVAVIVFLAEYGFRVLKKFSASRVLDTHDQGQLSYKKSQLYPPPYSTVLIGGLGGDTGKRQNINGRDYMVVNAKDGDTKLIPMRTPSAFLFQYAA